MAAVSVPATYPKSFAVKPSPETLSEVGVERLCREVRIGPVLSDAKEARPTAEPNELLDPEREVGVDERRPHEHAMLGAKAKRQPLAAHGDMSLSQCGDAVRPGQAGA